MPKDKLAEKFNITPLHEQKETIRHAKNMNDADLAKETIRETLEIAMDSLHELQDIAKNSQQPRTFEVLSGLIKTVGDMSSTLVEIDLKTKEFEHKIMKEEKEAIEEDNSANINVSLNDLIKALKNTEK